MSKRKHSINKRIEGLLDLHLEILEMRDAIQCVNKGVMDAVYGPENKLLMAYSGAFTAIEELCIKQGELIEQLNYDLDALGEAAKEVSYD